MPRAILLLITDLQIGGTPTVVRELAVRLNAPPEVVVDVACLGGHGPVVDQLRSAGIRVTTLDARGATDLRVFPRLRRLVVGRGYDTVFSFLVHANAAAAAVAPFCRGVRYIQSVQTTQPHPRWHWRVQAVAQRAADWIVVPSPSVAEAAALWSGIPADKLLVIPNAISIGDPSRDADSPPLPNVPPIPIGFIGRLDPVKRIPDLLEAVRLLHGRVHLHLFGEGSERPHIEKLIVELNLSPLVTLHGAIAGPRSALERIAVLVLPSAAEGFGLVLIEAMAAGVPVVATDVAGIRDVVRAGQTGLLVPPASPPQLAAAIGRLLDDQSLRERLVTTAAEDVRRRFTWDVVLPQYRALLGLA